MHVIGSRHRPAPACSRRLPRLAAQALHVGLERHMAVVQMSKRECNCVCLDPVQGFDLVFRFSVCVINLITDVVQYCHVHARIRRAVP